MADRRMFTKKITDDDNFMSLSASAQALYLHLSMSADDDGFCNQVSASMFKAHASVQDLEALLSKRYVYQFENGVIVIKHWRMANALRKDRYTPTAFQEELKKLKIKDNGAYSFIDEKDNVVADWLPSGCQVVATGESSIGKNSIGYTPLPPAGEWEYKKHSSYDNVNHFLQENEDYAEFFQEREVAWETLTEWLQYKTERGGSGGYKTKTGVKAFLKQFKAAVEESGEEEVNRVVLSNIASGYQGITWDKMQKLPTGNGDSGFICMI